MAVVEPRWEDFIFVVIPGIGGSLLEHVDGTRRRLVWGGARNAFARAVSPNLLRVSDDDGVRPCGVIDDWRVVRYPFVRGYGGLVREVANTTGLRIDWSDSTLGAEDAGVVVFSYDFRRSLVHAADRLHEEIDRRLTRVFPASHDRRNRVVLVCHSMGGLVAREWARRPGLSGWCRAIITLGTPHKGSPKALDVLQSGLTIRRIPVARRLSRVVQGWPSTYDLLPTYAMVDISGERVRPSDLEVDWLVATELRRASEFHQSMNLAWKALDVDSPSMTAVGGVGKPTLHSASLADGRVTMSNRPFLERSLLGDGTVPHESVMPYELDNARGMAVLKPVIGGEHGALVSWDQLRAELQRVVLARPSGLTLGDGGRHLVSDLDGFCAANRPLRVGVRAWCSTPAGPAPVESDDVSVLEARVVRTGVAGPWAPMEVAAGGGWTVQFPRLAPGQVTFETRATTRSGDDLRVLTEVLDVLDLDKLEEADASEVGE